MHPNWPLRWPEKWRSGSTLDVIKDTPVGCLLFPSTGGYEEVIARALQLGLTICYPEHLPPGVELEKGEWPGIRMTPGQEDASSGPTGAAWIDSNGWLVRLTRARKPGSEVWVSADPPKSNEIVRMSRHLVAVADAAAHGGRWVITLDAGLADGLAGRKAESEAGWRRLMDAIGFFAAHQEWQNWPVDAVIAVVSTFSGGDEFFSRELLNLTARTNVSYSIIVGDALRAESLAGLRAIAYPDAGPPALEVRQRLLDFAERGGLLIAGPQWQSYGTQGVASEEPHPRYEIRRFGQGRIAVARRQPDDPYETAQDIQVLVSHRFDRVRFFNGAVLGSYTTVSPGGNRRLAHVINYAGWPPDDPPTARIAGRFRSAKLWSLKKRDAQRLEMARQRDGTEVHLPRFDVYGGVELEA